MKNNNKNKNNNKIGLANISLKTSIKNFVIAIGEKS